MTPAWLDWTWTACDRFLRGGGRPWVMGIVNTTPDSFSDGGRFHGHDAAVAAALALAEAGADLIDIGGESSRPGAEPVDCDEELRRVIPVIAALTERLKRPISIDTTKATVAREAIAAGAVIINDITALHGDPGMASVAADTGAGVVLMHMRGNPRTMQTQTEYDDVVSEVIGCLGERLAWCQTRGIPAERIVLDPGIGFAKTNTQSLAILRELERFASLERPVLVGSSRKGFLGKLTGRPVEERQVASAVSALAAIVAGASIVRVHDVAAVLDAIRVWEAQRGWGILHDERDG